MRVVVLASWPGRGGSSQLQATHRLALDYLDKSQQLWRSPTGRRVNGSAVTPGPATLTQIEDDTEERIVVQHDLMIAHDPRRG